MERVFLDVFLTPTAGNQLILKTAREKDGCGQVGRHCAQECVHHMALAQAACGCLVWERCCLMWVCA